MPSQPCLTNIFWPEANEEAKNSQIKGLFVALFYFWNTSINWLLLWVCMSNSEWVLVELKKTS